MALAWVCSRVCVVSGGVWMGGVILLMSSEEMRVCEGLTWWRLG